MTNRKIIDKYYEHDINIWNKFEMKTMKFYHELRLKRDVLLINDVFEIFRNNCLNNHGLCPSRYVSVPRLSCDAMPEMIKVEIELIPDPDMHMFFEKSTRAVVSYISC